MDIFGVIGHLQIQKHLVNKFCVILEGDLETYHISFK